MLPVSITAFGPGSMTRQMDSAGLGGEVIGAHPQALAIAGRLVAARRLGGSGGCRSRKQNGGKSDLASWSTSEVSSLVAAA